MDAVIDSSEVRIQTLAALADGQMSPEGLGRLLAEWGLAETKATEALVELTGPWCGQWFNATRKESGVRVTANAAERPAPNAKRWISWPVTHSEQTFARFSLVATAEKQQALTAKLAPLFRAFGFFFHQRAAFDQVSNLALRDELTGCYNRRYLRQALEQWIPQARSERFPVSLFLLDVDHFKSFNDRFGHAVGDKVLQTLGKLMRSLFRSQDVVCRYGGEEFAILLCDHRSDKPAEHPQEVFRYAERLRLAAEKLELAELDQSLDSACNRGSMLSHVTISGGIATFPWDAGSADELLQKADEALYRAKNDGRNRIYLAKKIGIHRAA